MKVSRREFVNTAGCAAAAGLCALPSFGFAAASNPDARTSAGCTLLDLESNCALPESLAGMRTALGGEYRRVAEIAFDGTDSVVVVPAAGAVQAETFDSVRKLIEHGTTVLWESGAAFLEPSDFARQQALTLEHFGVSMAQPIDVWSRSASQRLNAEAKNQSARNVRAIGHERVPYVEFRWPRETRIRDFSRAIPVSAAKGQAIAHWGEIPIAWRKSLGAGTLIFVGSPIGPALYSGDSDAASLFSAMIAAS
jgi:hypothetical protein